MTPVRVILYALLTIIVSAELVRCSFEPPTISHTALEYKFGDRVYVQKGWYSGCSGYVVGYRYGFNDDVPTYRIAVKCVAPDGLFTYVKEIEFQKEELIQDDSQPKLY